MRALTRRLQHGGRIRIGSSGWRYPPWRGVFYPPDLVQRRELEYAPGRFTRIELNGSFYSLQRPESWQAWIAQTPRRFVFAPKGPRYIIHLRRNNVALVIADTAGKWPYVEDVTADCMYLRLHGDKAPYASGYSPEALDRWADRIGVWSRGGEPADAQRASLQPARKRKTRDVCCYFDNDIKVHAPFDAQALAERLGAPPAPPRE